MAMRVHELVAETVIVIGIESSRPDLSRHCSSQTLGGPREHLVKTWLKSCRRISVLKNDAEICQDGCIAGRV